MGLKKKLLYATLFASSCLFSTNYVVKADVTNANVEPAVSQNTETDTQTVQNTTDQTAPVSTDNKSTESNVESNTETNSVQNQSTADQVQTQDVQTTVTHQVQSDEKVDGVYTVGNQNTLLYNGDGTQVKNRMLGANSGWYTNARRTLDNGSTYYHVSTTEYANSADGTFQSYVQPYQGNATVVYKDGASIHSFNNYGNKAVYTGNNLATGSSWKISNHALMGGKDWYQVGANTWVPQDYVVVNNGQYKEAAWIAGVPLIAQRPELPNGCEITAVTMMLQYAGAKVDKMEMAREMPRSSNPNNGYIGQPWDSTGITIFPPALMNLVEQYTGTAKNLTGQNFDAIKYQINIGHPVVTWNTLYGFPYHALTVTGYDKNYVYYNDCWTDQTLQMGINQFINNWNTQNRRAISY